METDAKEAALKVIQSMPKGASLEDIIYALYFRQRVDRGLDELEEGNTLSHDAVKRNLAKWLQSTGP